MSTQMTSSPSMAPRGAIRLAPSLVTEAWSRWTARVRDGLSRQAFNRRVLTSLSRLSERDLADIGLTAADVRDAALSENGDATHFLVARRDARRTTWHGQRPF